MSTDPQAGSARPRPLVAIVCGSPADAAHAQAIAAAALALGLDAEVRIASAHRTPEHALEVVRGYDSSDRPCVIVTVAGRSNALSGFTDPQVSVPVIACPPPGSEIDLWSSVRLPAGVAPVLVLEPANAAIAAAKMLGLADPAVRDAVRKDQAERRERILEGDRVLRG